MPRPFILASATLLLANGVWATDQPTQYDPRAAFAETDSNQDGEIDVAEFHARLVEVFYRNDTNKDGFLSPAELNQLPFHEAFKDADASADGRVSLSEFVRIRLLQFEAADTNHDGELSLDEVQAEFAGKKRP